MMRVTILFLISIHFCSGQSKIDLEKAKEQYYQAKDLYYDGDYEVANLKFDSCIATRERLLESPHELLYKVYRRKGNTGMKLRDFTAAQLNLQKALSQADQLYGKESDEVAGVFMDFGVLEWRMHRYSKSIEWNKKCITLRTKLFGAESKEVAYTRMNNCNNLYSMGNFVKCINEYKKILIIYDRELKPDDENYNRVYLTLSNAYRKKGDLNNSLLYAKKALEIKLMNYDDDHQSVAKYYSSIAKIQATLYQLDDAKKNFEKSSKIEEKNGSKEDLLSNQNDAARVLLKSGDFESAKKIYQETIAFYPKNARKSLIAQDNLSLCLYYLGDVSSAYELLKNVLEVSPATEGFLKLSEWSRELGNMENAGRHLADAQANAREGDLLMNVQILVEQSIQQSEIDSEFAWKSINKAIEQLTIMRRRYLGSSSKNYINEELEYIFDHAVALALQRYEEEPSDELLAELYKTIEMSKAASFWDNLSEENAAFYGKVPLDILEEIELLKDEGEEKIVELEEKMTDLERKYPAYYNKKYKLEVSEINTVQAMLSNEMVILDYYVLDEEVIALQISSDDLKLIRTENKDKIDFVRELASLSEMNISRVVVVPHRFIHYESFEKIRNPQTGKFLLYDYAFSYQVNVDGIASEKDEEVSSDYLGFVPEFKKENSKEELAVRSTLVPLPAALQEIEEASGMFKGKVFRGKQANEENFYEMAPDFSFIHFATHAQIDPLNELNSFLVLNEGTDEEDGILYADEIMNTNLNADMVILSACETGNGGLRSGEGVMSLSRAFQYAGAKSVLMSLWRANDQSARPIIVDFLRNCKKGMTKDVALQQSKINYLKSADPLMRDEFYWAGFMINGDLSPIATSKPWITYFVAMLIVFGIVFLMFRLV